MVVQKCKPSFCHVCVKCWPVFKILSVIHSAAKCSEVIFKDPATPKTFRYTNLCQFLSTVNDLYDTWCVERCHVDGLLGLVPAHVPRSHCVQFVLILVCAAVPSFCAIFDWTSRIWQPWPLVFSGVAGMNGTCSRYCLLLFLSFQGRI